MTTTRYQRALLRLRAFEIISASGWGSVKPSTNTDRPAEHKKWNWTEAKKNAKELADEMEMP